MPEPQIIQGRQIGREQIAEIQALIEANPRWSRWRLSRTLAERWNWYAASGELKDMAARTLLLKLHQRQLIRLPERRRRPARRGPHFSAELLDGLDPDPVHFELRDLQPLRIELVGPRHPKFQQFERHLFRHHYLSYRGPVGENLAYLIQSRRGQDVACVLFGAAAWQCAPRDQWIGWSAAQRAQKLPFIANNSRFLILPWIQTSCLASHVLARVRARLSSDWQARYGHPLYLLESFVEPGRFAGTCYQAANWIHVGQTTGRTRQDRWTRIQAPVKDIYLCPLRRDVPRQFCR